MLYKQCKGSPSCSKLTTTGYCEEHTRKDNDRPNAYQRYGAGWTKTREYIIRRDPICKCRYRFCCGKNGCMNATNEVDHIIHKDYGEATEDNLMGMCKQCHSKKTRKEQQILRTINPAATNEGIANLLKDTFKGEYLDK